MYTSYYANPEVGVLAKKGYTPVRISLGMPRFSLVYKKQIIKGPEEIIPPREFLGAEKDLYKKVYTQMLDDYQDGYTEEDGEHVAPIDIIAKVRAMGDRLIFLCFCKPTAEFCHRHFFAEWYNKRVNGPKITEL